MYVFGYDRLMAGSFTAVSIDTHGGHGVWLELVDDQIPNSPTDDVIITGVHFGQREKFHIVDCFNDVAHTYAFGHDPMSSIISINFLGFLAPYCGQNSAGVAYNSLNTMLTAYARNRLSKQPVPMNLHMGQILLKGFLISIQSGTANVDYNIQSYSMELLAVDVIEPNYA